LVTLLRRKSLLNQTLNYEVDQGAVFNILPMLIKEGLKIIYYSGDQDAIVPLEGTMYWFQEYRKQFGAPIKKSWRPWVTASQNISGMLWQLEGLTLATVIGAGHMVPTDKPAEAL
jgi:serine carboxypeptidase-like clade 2